MSVHNEYTGYTLKHLLLRHMYNLLLPNLCATRSSLVALRLPTVDPYSTEVPGKVCSRRVTGGESLTLYCVVAYIAACLDASRMVFWDCSFECNAIYLEDVKDRSNTPKGCNAMYVEDVEERKRTYTHIFAHNFLNIQPIFNPEKVLEN